MDLAFLDVSSAKRTQSSYSVRWFDPNSVADGTANPRFAAEISLGCLNGSVPIQKLDLHAQALFANLPGRRKSPHALTDEILRQCICLKPKHRCEVEFVETTKRGRLRHAELRRLVS